MSPSSSEQPSAGLSEPTIVSTTETPTAVVRDTIAMGEVTAFYDRSFQMVSSALESQGRKAVGVGFARVFGIPTDTMDVEVGYPIDQPLSPSSGSSGPSTGEVRPGALPATRAAQTTHHGAFENLGSSWQALYDWITEKGERPASFMWEEYLVEPTPTMDPEELCTRLTWQLD